ncbi:hypothetical protein LFZ20_11565 [Salmonella enterica subsp. enterica serovar Johannesburg str. SA20025782]|nr:hypothetical protein LFZ20_11565 [Salmonella enterica subsp. enterica serovar Johannesburg str. SA20025782]
MNLGELQFNMPQGAVQSDGTHFNSLGYQRMGEAIASMLMAGWSCPILQAYFIRNHDVANYDV